jgi:hypothetical protein
MNLCLSLLPNHAWQALVVKNASLPLEKGQTHADMLTFFVSVPDANGHKLCPKCVGPLEMPLLLYDQGRPNFSEAR